MRAIVHARDHLGTGRDTTEDVHRLNEGLGLYLVCDGSRDPDGRWAAEAICARVEKELTKSAADLARYRAAPSKQDRVKLEGALHAAIQAACAEVYRACYVEKSRKPSSSALGAVLFLGESAITAHVGNTRLYLVREGKALRLTRDHTYYEEMLRQAPKGATINPAFKKRLTQAIGDSESVPLSIASVPLTPGDLLVLCTNGLSDHFSADAWELQTLSSKVQPQDLHTRLIDWAIEQKTDDNVTVVVLQVAADEATRAQPLPIQRDARKQIELLRSLKIFRGIRGDERALMQLQSLLTFRHAGPGDTLVQQGSPSDEMFVIVSGKTEVMAGGQRVAFRGPGDVIGEMGFFDGRLRSATVIAREPTEFMSILRWEFDALVEQDWRLGYRILQAVVVAMAAKIEEQLSDARPRQP